GELRGVPERLRYGGGVGAREVEVDLGRQVLVGRQPDDHRDVVAILRESIRSNAASGEHGGGGEAGAYGHFSTLRVTYRQHERMGGSARGQDIFGAAATRGVDERTGVAEPLKWCRV